MSSDDEEVARLMEDLEVGVSEVLAVSLLEVHACYFLDSDEGEDRDLDGEHEHECWLEGWACERRLEYQSYREDAALE
jgi:hypothetical protein